MGKTGFNAVMIMSVIATMMVQSVIGQTVHVVGGSLGWIVTGNDDVYDNWVDTRVFRVGDILTFNFTTGDHDVVEVTEASYDACTSTNIIGSIITTGPANITLTTAGEHNYICTFGGGRHCQSGQKLDINVLAAAPGTNAPPPSPTTPPPPRSTSGPATSPTTAPPPLSTNGPTMSPTTAPPPPSTNGPTMSPTTSPPPPSTNGPTMSPTTSPPPPSTNGPTMSPTTSPTPPSTNGPATTSPPPAGSSSSIVLGSVFVTFVSIASGLFL